MQKRFYFYILSFILISFAQGFAQNDFKNEDELKKTANTLFEEEKYEEANKLFSQLVANYPQDPDYNYKYGTCLLYATEDKEKPLTYLNFASKKPNVDNDVFYQLGKALQLNYKFEEAIKAYENFKKSASAKAIQKRQVDHSVEECQNGKTLLSHITSLSVLDKKDLRLEDFYISYEINDLGGKLVVKPEDFMTPVDIKKGDKSLMFIAPGANEYYFSSYGENEKNSRDIYKVVKLPSGEFSKPINLGPNVNTAFDEDYPFMHPDGYLYFASKGHNSMGGYDVFKSDVNFTAGTFSKAQNMDFAINSPDDDIMYITDKDKKLAYFASRRNSINGRTHIYKISLENKFENNILIAGKLVVPADAKKIGNITVRNLDDGRKVVGIFRINPNTSKYTISAPKGANLQFTVEVAGYSTLVANVATPANAEASKPIRQELKPNPGDPTALVLENKFDETLGDEESIALLKEKASLNVNADEMPVDFNNITPATKDSVTNNETAPIATSNADSSSSVANTNTATNINNTAVAESTKVDTTNTSAIANNETQTNTNSQPLNEQTLVNLAYDDAKENQQEANELKAELEIATQLSKKKEENYTSLNTQLDAAKTSGDAAKTFQLTNETQAAQKEMNVSNALSVSLEKQLQTKQKEAESSLAYANELETAVRSNSKESISKLMAQQQQIQSEQKTNNEGAAGEYEESKANADKKNEELANQTKTVEGLQKDISDIQNEKSNLNNEISKTKDKELKASFENQIKELDTELTNKQIALVQAQEKQNTIKASADSAATEAAVMSALLNEIKSSAPAVASNATSTNTTSNTTNNNPAANTTTTTKDSTATALVNPNNTIAASETTQTEKIVTAPPSNVKPLAQFPLSENLTETSKEEILKRSYLIENNNALLEADKITDPLAREQKKLTVFNEINNQINIDLNVTREKFASSSDAEETAELKEIITELEKLNTTNAEKVSQTNTNIAALQSGQPIVHNTTNSSLPASANIAPTALVVPEGYTPGENYNSAFENALAQAATSATPAETEQKKKDINNQWANKINSEIQYQKSSLTQPLSDSAKTALNEKIKSLDNLRNEKLAAASGQPLATNNTTFATNNAAVSDSSNSNKALAANTNNAVAGTDTIKANNNAIPIAANTTNANLSPANNASPVTVSTTDKYIPKESVYSEIPYYAPENENNIKLLGKMITDESSAKKRIDSLNTLLLTTPDEAGKSNINRQIDEEKSINLTRGVQAADLAGMVNHLEYSANKNTLDTQLAALKTSEDNNVNIASMLNDEATTYYNEAKTIRDVVKNTTDESEKKNSLEKAYSLEKRAIEKQAKAKELLTKQGTTPILAANTTNTNTTNGVVNNPTNANVVSSDTTVNSNKNNASAQVGANNNTSISNDSIKASPEYQKFIGIMDEAKATGIQAAGHRSKVNDATAKQQSFNMQSDSLKNVIATTTVDSVKTNATTQLATIEKEKALNDSVLTANQQMADSKGKAAEEKRAEASTYLTTIEPAKASAIQSVFNIPPTTNKTDTTTLASAQNNNKVNDQNVNGVITTNASNVQVTNAQGANTVKPTIDGINTPQVMNPLFVKNQNGNQPAVVANNANTPKNTNNTNTPVKAILPVKTNNAANNNAIANNPAPRVESTNPNKAVVSKAPIKLPSNFAEVDAYFEKNASIERTADNPIPLDAEMPSGVIFKVQIGAFRKPIPVDLFKGFNPLMGESTPRGITRYTAGLFKKFDVADKAKTEIQALGYKDAFVVAFYNGKRIEVDQAVAMLNGGNVALAANTPEANKNVAVENTTPTNNNGAANTSNTINTSAAPANNGTVAETKANLNSTNGLLFTVQVGVYSKQVSPDKISNVQPLYEERTSNGYIRYTSGVFNNFSIASTAKDKVVGFGVKDAFVIAFNDGKKISNADAEKIIAEKGANAFANMPGMNDMPYQSGNAKVSENKNTRTNEAANVQPKPAVENNQQLLSNNQPAITVNEQPTTNSQQPIANNNQPTTNNQQNPIVEAGSNFADLNALRVVDNQVDTGIVFKVQIGAFRNEVPNDIAIQFLSISDKGIKHMVQEDGMNIYVVGFERSYNTANDLKNYVQSRGLKDAFIVAFKNGKKTDVEEAKRVQN